MSIITYRSIDGMLKRSRSIPCIGRSQQVLEGDVVTELLTPETPVKGAPTTLLIVFAGLGQEIGGGKGKIPPFEFVNTLRANKLADISGGRLLVVFMRDRWRSWYFKGVQGVSDSLQGTVEYLKLTARKVELPRRVICLGSSMGGYGAILHGVLLAKAGVPVDQVIAFSPQIYLDPIERLKRKMNTPYEETVADAAEFVKRGGDVPKEYRRYLSLTALAPLPCSVDVHVGVGPPQDIKTAVELCKAHTKEALNSYRLRVVKHKGGGHNIVTVLRDRGVLLELLKSYLAPAASARDIFGKIICSSDEASCSRSVDVEGDGERTRDDWSLPALTSLTSVPVSPENMKKHGSQNGEVHSPLSVGSKLKRAGL